MSNYSRFDSLDNLIHKIYKFASNNEKGTIKSLILNKSATTNDLKTSMNKISTIAPKYVKQLKLKKDENRQDFIVSKILSFIRLNEPSILNDSLTAVDIGGGNGNVLSSINNVINADKKQFICVESKDWIENYKYDNSNITYTFWNNNTIDILDESCDLVFCMVSLHHMTNETLTTVLNEINRILKKGGILMMKEHDCNSIGIHKMIMWEHHLYHLLDCAYDNHNFDFDMYYVNSIYNFKSKKEWQSLMETHNFNHICSKNRFLDGDYSNSDPKNATNLYWDIYKK